MHAPPNPLEGADFVALGSGQTVGRYEVLGVLGHGGFGITYRARDRQLGREVAIKEYLPPSLAVRQDGSTVLPRSPREADDFIWGRERFVDEGRTLAGLQKARAIVRVYDFLEDNGTAYIVMELVHGETLDHRLKRTGKLDPVSVERLLWPLLDGLARVHAAGFLHRDIKPANILLDAEGDPTLIDFGASRAAVADRTSAMTAVFTPGYAAAEQVTSAPQGPWTDIYALSATLHHAIAGKPPPNVFDRMMDDRYEPLSRLRPPGFAPSLLSGLDAGLALRASDRPQSIAGWRTVLTQAPDPDVDATVISRPFRAAIPPPRAAMTAAREAAAPSRVPASLPRRTPVRSLAAMAIIGLMAGGYYAWTAHRDSLEAIRIESARLEKQAAEEARRKVELSKVTTIAAEPKAPSDDLVAAQMAEAALRLGVAERQRVQVALTAAGFDTRGSDGTFGPRSREMIAAWQKTQNQPATGFLTAAQAQVLQRESTALARQDEERRRGEDEKRKAEEATRARTLPVPAPAAPPAPFDGSYGGFFSPSGALAFQAIASRSVSLRITGGSGAGTMLNPGCGPTPVSIRISQAGEIAGEAMIVDSSCARFPMAVEGRAANGQLRLSFSGAAGSGSASLVLGVPATAAGQASAAGQAARSLPAGGAGGSVYRGSLTTLNPAGPSFVLGAQLQLAGTRLSGQISSQTCGVSPIALTVSAGGEIGGELVLKANATCSSIALTASGRMSGDRLALDLRGAGLRAQGTLDRRGD